MAENKCDAPAHRIITDYDELHTLPKDTVIRHVDATGWTTVYERWSDGWYGLGLIDEPTQPGLPARVLYDPTQE